VYLPTNRKCIQRRKKLISKPSVGYADCRTESLRLVERTRHDVEVVGGPRGASQCAITMRFSASATPIRRSIVGGQSTV
jgi:hypothetical protein